MATTPSAQRGSQILHHWTLGLQLTCRNGSTLEYAQNIANHESPRTTELYDLTREKLTFEEVERVKI
jgi:integrase/recombinase XerD